MFELVRTRYESTTEQFLSLINESIFLNVKIIILKPKQELEIWQTSLFCVIFFLKGMKCR